MFLCGIFLGGCLPGVVSGLHYHYDMAPHNTCGWADRTIARTVQYGKDEESACMCGLL